MKSEFRIKIEKHFTEVFVAAATGAIFLKGIVILGRILGGSCTLKFDKSTHANARTTE